MDNHRETEALRLIEAWLAGDETCATLQRARAWVDARRAAATLDRATFERLVDEGQQLRRQYERDSAPMRTRGAGDPPPSADYPRFVVDPERRNCWTCRWSAQGATVCRGADGLWGRVWSWRQDTHRGADRCPPDADGCPGWQPTDPPPFEEVPRG